MATKVQCPASEDCEFEGEPQSVHAHITASTDHKGESGVSYQREIAELLPNGEQAPWERGTKGLESDQWETVESDNDDNEETDAEGLDEQGNDGNEESKETPEEEEYEGVGVAETAGAVAATGAAAMAGGDGDQDGSGGIPIPVSTEVLVVLVIAGLLVAFYLRSDTSESDQEEIVDDDQEEPSEGTGLIAG